MSFVHEVLNHYSPKIIGRQPAYLLEHPDDGENLGQFKDFPNALQLLLREWLAGRRTLDEMLAPILDHKHPDIESLPKKDQLKMRLRHGVEAGLEGLQFAFSMDVGDRAVNGLREKLKKLPGGETSKFGEYYWNAMDNPLHSDHNFPHNRRVERWIEAFLMNIGELRHEESVEKWVDSMMLYGFFHDVDQVLTLERNIPLPDGQKLNVKKAHAIAASVMMLALHKRYAEARGVGLGEAWRICAGAAFMTLKHDEPERFLEAINAMKPSYSIIDGQKVLLQGDELISEYINNRLDLTTLAPSQLIEILKHIKSTAGFIGVDSIFGLLPIFESEYMADLKELEANHDILIRDLTPKAKRGLHLAAEVAVRADLMEMVTPPAEAMLRSLLTQFSFNRPFFRSEVEDDQLINLVLKGPGNLDEGDSDLRRLLWEFIHNDEFDGQSPVGKSKYKQKMYEESAITGILMLKRMAERILRHDYREIDSVYEKRAKLLLRKSLYRAGLNPFQVIFNEFRIEQRATNFTEYQNQLLEFLHKDLERLDLSEIFTALTQSLDYERQSIITTLIEKEKRFGYGYSEEDAKRADRLCDQILGRLKEQYRITDRQMKRYKRIVAKMEYPRSVPYKTFDPSAGKPRVLIKPSNTGT